MLSGAGSSLLAIVDDAKKAEIVGSAMQAAWLQSDIKAEYIVLDASKRGTYITDM
jgi:homoserine kinase